MSLSIISKREWEKIGKDKICRSKYHKEISQGFSCIRCLLSIVWKRRYWSRWATAEQRIPTDSGNITYHFPENRKNGYLYGAKYRTHCVTAAERRVAGCVVLRGYPGRKRQRIGSYFFSSPSIYRLSANRTDKKKSGITLLNTQHLLYLSRFCHFYASSSYLCSASQHKREQ